METRTARERLIKDMNTKMKQIQDTHNTVAPSEYLTEAKQLEVDTKEVQAMWCKSVDTTNKICNKQEELNTRKDKNLYLSQQENKLKLARVPLPTFSGEMQDYLMFKDDWTMLVARELDNASKLC